MVRHGGGGGGLRLRLTATVLVIGAAAVLAAAGLAADGKTYTDPTGDPAGLNGQGSDVTQLTVGHTATTFTLRVTTLKPLVELHSLYLYLDTDRNPTTGDDNVRNGTYPWGFEYTLGFNNGNSGSSFTYWDGTIWRFRAGNGFTALRSTPTTIEYSVPRAAIGNPAGLDFQVRAISVGTYYTERVDVDFAPDTGFYAYDFQTAVVALGKAKVTPARPKAGTTATASAAVTGPAGAAKVKCTARIVGGASLKATGSLAGKRAACKVKLPPTARNRSVRGQLVLTAGGSTAKVPFAFKTAA